MSLQDVSLRNLQKVELDILHKVTALCDENKIKYFLLDGTMLGCVRHKGFIPWDDDVDIGIPRPDYDRFIKIASEQLAPYLKLMNFRLSDEYDRPNTRVVNEKVILHHDSYTDSEKAEPAWIDVFPLDGMPNNIILFELHKFYFLWNRMLYHFSSFDRTVNLTRQDRTLLQKILINFGRTFRVGRSLDTKRIVYRLERILKKYDYNSSKSVVNAYSSYMFRETYKKEWMGNGKILMFENYPMCVPEDYDKVLSHLYGNYMQPPEENLKEKHHNLKVEFLP